MLNLVVRKETARLLKVKVARWVALHDIVTDWVMLRSSWGAQTELSPNFGGISLTVLIESITQSCVI